MVFKNSTKYNYQWTNMLFEGLIPSNLKFYIEETILKTTAFTP